MASQSSSLLLSLPTGLSAGEEDHTWSCCLTLMTTTAAFLNTTMSILHCTRPGHGFLVEVRFCCAWRFMYGIPTSSVGPDSAGLSSTHLNSVTGSSSESTNMQSLRHEDGGSVTRSASGRLPPAYRPWDQSSSLNDDSSTSLGSALENPFSQTSSRHRPTELSLSSDIKVAPPPVTRLALHTVTEEV